MMLDAILNFDFILYSVPLYIGLMLAEIFWTHLKKKNQYRLNDTLSNLSCGVISEVQKITTFAIGTYFYTLVHKNYALIDMTQLTGFAKIVSFVGLLIGIDFFYYWYHRFSHSVNVLWASHIVHHQSEEYNLGVALRQSAVTGSFAWIFYLPLAYLGYPVIWFLSLYGLNLTYQFWIHTREIDKMPQWFEWLFNTPSHHRVHHGRNPKYLDKNHGGILIIWDRMFGTFEAESEVPVYGIVSPLQTWDPFTANFHHFVYITKEMFATKRLIDKVKVWFMPPDWRPADLPQYPPAPHVTPESTTKFETKTTVGMQRYLLLQFVIAFAGAFALLHFKHQVSPAVANLGFVSVCLTFSSLAFLAMNKSWAKQFEALRLVLVPLLIYISFS